jgi:hypothetical protein
MLYAPDFPIVEIKETQETGILTRPFGSNIRWFLKHHHPFSKIFKTRKEAQEFRNSHIAKMFEFIPKLRAGDLIFKLPNYHVNKLDTGFTQIKYIHNDSEIIKSESKKRKLPSNFESVQSGAPNTRLFVSTENKMIREDEICDLIIIPDKQRLKISNGDDFNYVEVGDRIDGKVAGLHVFKQSVDRIMKKSIVIDGFFYSVTKVQITTLHSNEVKFWKSKQLYKKQKAN